MHTPLTTPPFTPKIITSLKQLNIDSVEDLRLRGAVTTFLQIKSISNGITQSLLWQLIGVIQNRKAQSLSAAEKAQWRQLIKQHPPVAVFPSQDIMQQWMKQALNYAQKAMQLQEIPVGAVVVHDNKIIGSGYNRCISDHNISHHAEIQALAIAGKRLSNYRLYECDVYVTLEPCAMCASALIQARVKRVIYGTTESKTGAAGSVIDLFANRQLNTHTAVIGGIMAVQSRQLLQCFFQQKRQSNDKR